MQNIVMSFLLRTLRLVQLVLDFFSSTMASTDLTPCLQISSFIKVFLLKTVLVSVRHLILVDMSI